MKLLENKTALITGCNRGIGKAILEKFVREGANIVACSRNITEELKQYYLDLEKNFSVKIYPLVLDLSNDDMVKSSMKELYSWKIPIDILINNAGVASFSNLTRFKISDIKNVFQVNYFGPLLIIQHLIKLLMKSKNACIINLTSIAALDGTVGNCAYGASKSAIALMTKTLSKELSNCHIRVNAIAPGFIETDMQNSISTEYSQEIIQGSCLKRMGTPEEVANLAAFLSSEDSSYITGQIIRIDGGL